MKALYLEPDEEITSVVDRLRALGDSEVAIVIPKRAGLLQSIINLKLLRYQAEQQKKKISIVTSDKTGRNLASAVGLTVYQKLPEGTPEPKKSEPKEPAGAPVAINFRKKPPKDEPKVATHEPVKMKTSKAAPKISTHELKEAPATDWQVEKEKPEPEEKGPGIVAKFTKPITDKVPIGKTGKQTKKKADKPVDEVRPPKRTEASDKRRFSLPPVRLPKVRLPKKYGAGAIAAVIGVLLLAGSAAAAAFLPKANVTLTPKTDPLVAEIPMTFSVKAQAADAANNVLPAKVIEVTKDGSKQITATGSQAGGAKAQGDITVVNTTGATQRMVARTRFQAPNGQIYRAQAAVTAPAGGQTTVQVVADEGGEAGNLPAGTRLTIPGLGGGSAVYGETTAAGITGGSSSPTKNVSQQDIERGRTELSAEVAKNGLEDAKGRLAVSFKLDPQVASTNVLRATAAPGVNTVAEAFTLTGQVRVAYFTYQDEELQKILKEDLAAKVPAGSDIVDEQLSQTFVVTQSSSDQLTGVMRISTFTAVETSRDQIKQDIAGKTPEEAQKVLRDSGRASDVSIDLSPFWVKSIPKDADKIDIHFATAGGPASPSPSASPSQAPRNPNQPEI